MTGYLARRAFRLAVLEEIAEVYGTAVREDAGRSFTDRRRCDPLGTAFEHHITPSADPGTVALVAVLWAYDAGHDEPEQTAAH